MKNWRAAFAILGCVALVIVLTPIGMGFALGAALALGAKRNVYERVKSPDGWHEARVQFDDGGALSGFERLVWLKHSWNVSDEPLLSCMAFWADGEAKVDLAWQDSSTLIVTHHVAPKNIREIGSHCGPIRIIARAAQPFENF
ncbi:MULTISPECIES: hypothetical protein [unclassified Sphingomonas]|uniref:hypothetical protein n=1 Tax=unclassified Sphingomonas TaxID=196159 RepID=UPI002269B882|nr:MULTISPECIES: hypothetical protein [unclassified Sphingomonas]